MLTTRVIPTLLLRGKGLVKTVRFSAPVYLGDAVNVVRIFNDKEVDELILLDIQAHAGPGRIQWDLLAQIASEAFMPLCYGGGVTTLEEMRRLFGLGLEKVAVNTAAASDPGLIERAARVFGSQSVVAAVDVRRSLLGRPVVYTHGGSRKTGLDLMRHVMELEQRGAGELLVTSIDRDGTGRGYDLELVRQAAGAVRVPVIACGGAGSVDDLAAAVHQGGASAVAAGSLFVFHGRRRGVLITYPDRSILEERLARPSRDAPRP